MSPPYSSAAPPAGPAPPPEKAAVRAFGRYALRQLIAKSERSMVWLAHDPRTSQDVTLTLPRVQPDDSALDFWKREVGLAARLNHPNLAAPIEISVQDHWPYMAVDRAYGVTLGEWLALHPAVPMAEMVRWVCKALEGLAFAHDAGAAHGDLQFHSLLFSEQGTVRLCGFAVGREPPPQATEVRPAVDGNDLRQQRSRAERDVLAMGLIAYRLFSGHSPLDKDDVSTVIDRLPPHGRDIVRLPWSTARPVPEALRAIVNRATAAQERQRYLNARTLLRALNGWLEVEGNENGGPLTLLIDRLRAVGHLPALPGLGQRIASLTKSDAQRNDELAQQVLQDMALSFELLRVVNSSMQQAPLTDGAPAVITVRRALALLGMDGIRRAGNSLRAWPGPLNPAAAEHLQRLMGEVRLAGRLAQALRPAGYDPEVVYLVVMWQNLGRLLIAYHFPEEAQQIKMLMRSAPSVAALPTESNAVRTDMPGLSESMASLAVLGVNIEAVGAAVARHWGLGDEVEGMMRRSAVDRPVRALEDDADVLRNVASAANEVVDAVIVGQPARLGAALVQIAKRYGRV
ncbi:MAG: HDOD domain-containing protein, partial [Ideonella sp.]